MEAKKKNKSLPALSPSLDTLILVAIFFAASASTIIWTLKDRTPPPWDPSDHIITAYDYYRPLARLTISDFSQEFFSTTHYYAPAVHLTTALIFLIAGPSKLGAIAVNLISLAVLLGSVYSIARSIHLPVNSETSSGPAQEKIFVRRGAVIAAMLTVSYHFSAWLIHDAFLDYPLMAIVSLTFALLLKAGDFRNTSRALAFGLSAGVGMLTKQTFPFFFILPAAYVCLSVARSRDRKAISNLALSALVAAAIASIWYLPHLGDVIAIYRVNRAGAINEREPAVLSLTSMTYYWRELFNSQLQLPFTFLFLYGLVYSIKRTRKETLMLYLWLASGLLSFTLIANKDIRYTVPVLPAVSLISICWIARPAKKFVSRKYYNTAVALIIIWCVASFANAQWPAGDNGLRLDLRKFKLNVFARNYFAFDHRPLSDDWGVPEIVATVVSDWRESRTRIEQASLHNGVAMPRRERPVIGVIVNLPFLNPSNVALYCRLLAPGRASPPVADVKWLVYDSERDNLYDCDYLLVRTGIEQSEWLAPLERFAQDLILENSQDFNRVAVFPIPIANAEAVILKINRRD